MAGPLAGLTGLYGPEVPHGTTGRDPSEWGTPVDEQHGQPGGATGLPTKGGQYPQDPALVGEGIDPAAMPSGQVQDQTPVSHAAPVVRGLEQLDDFDAAAASQALHRVNLGGPRFLHRAPEPDPGTVEASRSDVPGASILVQGPKQLASGSTDVDQGLGVANSVREFAVGHQFRRTYTDPVPQDYSEPRERPFFGKHAVRQPLMSGDDSPYGIQGDFTSGMNLGPIDPGYPTPYQQPADPVVLPSTAYPNEALPIGAEWMGG